MTELFIGLMSGSSLDGIDAALADFSEQSVKLVATHSEPFSATLRSELNALLTPGEDEINRLGNADLQLGELFATAVNKLLAKANISAAKVRAIGSHGQNIRHQPQIPFTLQIGDPNVIAARTGITTVADFRRRDLALGGQGAPLAPAFHRYLFHSNQETRVILNIGGIANITVLPTDAEAISGFDTGPGNALLDTWIAMQQRLAFDQAGDWARSGQVDDALLQAMLADPFFQKAPPKSTGKEYFNLAWLRGFIGALKHTAKAADVQATLLELTARTISEAIARYAATATTVIVCGGGAYNDFLMQCLQQLLSDKQVVSSQTLGYAPDWIEALAFAWLARQTINGDAINFAPVTGAEQATILGGVYFKSL